MPNTDWLVKRQRLIKRQRKEFSLSFIYITFGTGAFFTPRAMIYARHDMTLDDSTLEGS